MKDEFVDRETFIRREFLTSLYQMAESLPDPINSNASRVVFQMVNALVTRIYSKYYTDDQYYQDLVLLCIDLMAVLHSDFDLTTQDVIDSGFNKYFDKKFLTNEAE